MSKVWFSADTHFGHTNIIDLAKRPFLSVEKMDSELVDHWNTVVGIKDVVYFLGDLTFKGREKGSLYLKALHGRKHLIYGNHDSNAIRSLPYWESVSGYTEVNLNGTRIILCHYPILSWNGMHHGSMHLHGHCHNNIPSSSQRLDVGVDAWAYYPVSLPEILARAKNLPKHVFPEDHHQPKDFAADSV